MVHEILLKSWLAVSRVPEKTHSSLHSSHANKCVKNLTATRNLREGSIKKSLRCCKKLLRPPVWWLDVDELLSFQSEHLLNNFLISISVDYTELHTVSHRVLTDAQGFKRCLPPCII